MAGAIIEPAAYFQKYPPRQIEDRRARELVEEFIIRYGHQAKSRSAKDTLAAALAV
ncbi:MAG TPA: hypothetical protein VJ836_04180 [Candidatus Saccharimonadales bacterium]|nr:hypothetical protein [Candidatus Saccharimonadales bacterium]